MVRHALVCRRVAGPRRRWLIALLATLVLTSPGASASAVDYVETVLGTPNLLGYWRFTTSSQADSVVNGYTGTFQGDAQVGPAGSGPALVGDPADTAVLLDGAGDWVMSGGVNPLRGQIVSEGTILAWFDLDVLPSTTGRIFTIAGESQVGNDFDLQIEPDDKIRFFTEAGASTSSPAALTASDLDTWHFVGATFQANVADSRILYLDGVPVASSAPGTHFANSSPFNIGESDVFQGRFFQGRIDEVAVFDRALTAAEIADVYAARAISTTTTTTTLPCTTARCTIDAELSGPECADEVVPPAVGRKLDHATSLIDRAGGSPPKKAKRLLKQAKHTLTLAGKAAGKAAKGKKPKLTKDCAAAIRRATDTVGSGLGEISS